MSLFRFLRLPGPPSLTRRLVVPIVWLLVVAVAVNGGFAAWLAARRADASARERGLHVASVLRLARVAPSLPVLRALQQRTGDDFVLYDAAHGTVGLATLATDTLDGPAIRRGLVLGETTLGGKRYRVGEVRLPELRPSTLLVLAPIRPLAGTIDILWPFLLMAAATLALLVPLAAWTSRRLAAPLGEIDRQVGRIADGDFGRALPLVEDGSQPEEIRRLIDGVNRMSSKLATLESSLVAGERQRLLGQLAAGFAHELRNAVTGASLAIDLHRRRCPAGDGTAGDESLAVAKRQLEILEEEVRGLLALGKPVESRLQAVPIQPLLDEVARLVAARCEHAGVNLECRCDPGVSVEGHREPLRAALVNLALNGIDAAGHGGRVTVEARRNGPAGATILSVTDTGRGPPEAIRESIREPFVTGKPEGIGLGLAVVGAVADMHGGALEWRRENGQTVFELRLPRTTLEGNDLP